MPEDTQTVLSIIDQVNEKRRTSDIPILVHCRYIYSISARHFKMVKLKNNLIYSIYLISAGVGRTGTFIVIDSLIELIKANKIFNIYQYVVNLRKQRVSLVQKRVCF